MRKRVVITGIGVRVSNAKNYNEFVEALKELIPGQTEITLFDTDKIRTNIACQIKEDLKYNGAADERTNAIAFEAIDDLFQEPGIKDMLQENKDEVVFSFSSSMAGNENMMRYVDSDEEDKENNKVYAYIVPDFINKVSEKLGISGPVYTTMSACAAGTAAAGIAIDEIRSGNTDLAVVGGTDALTLFSTVGFHSLKVLSAAGCKPFDEERSGINLGEASAFFIFEEYEHAKKRNAAIYAEVLGYSIKNEAYHMTSPMPDGEGAYIAMKEALEDSNISIKDEVTYINAHGTGTNANDLAELKAIQKLFEDRPNVYASSTKAITGHCLGAAGSIELAAAVAALHNKIVPGTFRTEHAIKTKENIKLVTGKTLDMNIDYAISNSFAFAGNTASIVLRKYEEE